MKILSLKNKTDNVLAIVNIVCTVYFVYYCYMIRVHGAYVRNPLCWLCCSVMLVLTGYLMVNYFRGRGKYI